MTKTERIKQITIENFLLHLNHEEPTTEMKTFISQYIEDDHVNEITESLKIHEDDLGVHTTCLNCGCSSDI